MSDRGSLKVLGKREKSPYPPVADNAGIRPSKEPQVFIE
jgi:hypothetical protein